jgi:hypothetical protein
MKLYVVILCGNATCRFFYHISRLPRVPDDSKIVLGLQSISLLKQREGSKHLKRSSPLTKLALNFRNSSTLLAVL